MVRISRRHTPDFVTSRALARSEPFLQLLAFGFTFDHTTSREYVVRLSDHRERWITMHGAEQLTDDQLGDLLTDITRDAIAVAEPDRPLTLGLTSGYDSRPLLWAYHRAGIRPHTYTFGHIGKLDYDLARIIDDRARLGGTFIDVQTARWSLDDYDRAGLWVKGLPISPRLLTAAIIDARHPGRVEIHGYLNQRLTCTYPSPPGDWREAVGTFAAANDTFGFQGMMPPSLVHALLPKRPLLGLAEMAADRQLFYGLRAAQRLRPPAHTNHSVVVPYEDERWVGYWLSRPPEETLHQRRWIRFLHTLDGGLFPDLEPFRDEDRRWALQKQRLGLVYGDDHHPGWVDTSMHGAAIPETPTQHFSVTACYRNNESFRTMVGASLTRLDRRGVFAQSLLDSVVSRFTGGDSAAAATINGLVAVDIALEAGMFP